MKYKPAVLLLTALFSAAMFGGCATEPTSAAPTAQVQSAIKLADRNWDSFNKAQLEKLLNNYGKNSPGYNPAKPPYAVFDWDNTMVFLDIEEAVFIYQLENLRFSMPPEQMNKALRMEVPKSNFGKDYNNAAGQPVNIDLVVQDAVDSYRWIYNNYKGLKGKKSLEEIKKNPHYTNFVTKARYMYEAIGDTFDVAIAYPWVLYQFSGMNEKQIRQMVNETIAWQKTQPIEKVKWTSPASLAGKAGVVSVSWKNGLRMKPEMKDLWNGLREAGIDIWVCSASFVDVVKEFSSNPLYGYNNPDDRVIAMELERDAKGVVQTAFRHGYDQTQQKGKTKAISRFIVPKYGYGPILVAGDSEGDMNMMQDFRDTKAVLIINRLKGQDIAKMSKEAYETYGKPDAKILLQGRNDNTGEFVKSQAHFKLGSKQGQVLK